MPERAEELVAGDSSCIPHPPGREGVLRLGEVRLGGIDLPLKAPILHPLWRRRFLLPQTRPLHRLIHESTVGGTRVPGCGGAAPGAHGKGLRREALVSPHRVLGAGLCPTAVQAFPLQPPGV